MLVRYDFGALISYAIFYVLLFLTFVGLLLISKYTKHDRLFVLSHKRQSLGTHTPITGRGEAAHGAFTTSGFPADWR